MFVGMAQAGEFSLGGAHLLAQNTAQVDVNVNFADRSRSMRETTEGGSESTARDARMLRGADEAVPAATDERPAAMTSPRTAKPATTEPAPVTSDSPHGVSISPAAAIRRPSYRWQSLVPGTIK